MRFDIADGEKRSYPPLPERERTAQNMPVSSRAASDIIV